MSESNSKQKKIVCCECCGRDTSSKWGYCTRCIGPATRKHVEPTGRDKHQWLQSERNVENIDEQ
jgi:predicted amidophosphoribosyltransferase